ncbi:unnamed protein product [Gongylonema pulchrum]|uniref:EGF-like domain-containing protein n=1 Tax=Gongylonema pulchrum TaxID=637853 RepID=A0A183EDC8_9BILA|nr:unnamed protein product [Gongylonema pulchrum]
MSTGEEPEEPRTSVFCRISASCCYLLILLERIGRRCKCAFYSTYCSEIPLRAWNDDVDAHCRNGGIMVGHRCVCPYPYTGTRCLDFACVHGISVGIRYDPDSLFFNKPCICDEDWSGDLCDISKTNQVKFTSQPTSVATATLTLLIFFFLPVHTA